MTWTKHDQRIWSIYEREWREAKKQKLIAYHKAYDATRNKNNKDKKRREAYENGDLTFKQWSSILEEFDYSCAYCLSTENIQIEHIIPIALNGQHTKSNVVPACSECNKSKWSKKLEDWIDVDKILNPAMIRRLKM